MKDKNLVMNDDEEEFIVIFNSPKEKREFLAELVSVPYTSIIGDDDRLLEEIKNWISY